MRKIITYLIAALLISVFMGCAYKTQDKIVETNPGFVNVDSSDYNEIEAKDLADTQCAKSKRRAQKINKPNEKSNQYHYFTCVL
ncbi:MAG: hypothetical protein OSB01_02650 [Nitrosomonadaceae bacterium]|jgi:hypothetical protein|nr:hypothetical protein [Nitrosomonadaceae bacterium]|tara:strand:+ start:189 stop:440 length:252 start_codon:yes stop_codon:yes gene_type:complete